MALTGSTDQPSMADAKSYLRSTSQQDDRHLDEMLNAALAIVDEKAPNAPTRIARVACLRIVAYLFELRGDEAALTDGGVRGPTGSVYRLSGAGSLLSEYESRSGAVIRDDE